MTTAIGGKTKAKRPSQPQIVVQRAQGINEFAKFEADQGQLLLSWVGDPKEASKFSSRFSAKERIREIADIPETRCFKELS